MATKKLTRMTAGLRDCIANAFHATISDATKATNVALGELAEEFRKDMLGKYAEIVDDLPNWVVETSTYLRIHVCETVPELSSGDFVLNLPKSRVTPLTHLGHPDIKRYKAGHHLIRRLIKLRKERKRLAGEINKAESQVRAILNASRTVKGLLEAWPEAEQFLPEGVGIYQTGTALMIPVDDLNARMKALQKQAAKAA